MGPKKGRGAKVVAVSEDKKGSSFDHADSPNLSAIERASFLEGLQPSHGNPLHSTALEEDLNVLEKGQPDDGKAVRKDIPQTVKQRGGAVKRKNTERDGENKEEEKKKSRRSTGGKVKARPEMEGETQKKKGAPQRERGELDVERKEPDPSSNLQKSNQLTSAAGSLKGRSAGRTSAARPVKNQQMKKDKKRQSTSGSGNSGCTQSQEESDADTAQQRRRKILSSDEEAGDEDTSWKPSPKKANVYSFSRTRKSSSDKSKTRKSSSGSGSAEPDKASTDKQRKRRGRQGETELDVVLDAFLDFCDQYRESVESKAVKQSIDSFSSNVKEQLLEKISSSKELKVLKRENAKVGSLIRTKTQRLLDAKHELMRAERQMWLLQKEKAELKLRLADLRRGQAFLHDIRELCGHYLDYRHKHPKEKETYGASSLPALLLETKHIQVAEHQLRGTDNQRGERQKKNGTRR